MISVWMEPLHSILSMRSAAQTATAMPLGHSPLCATQTLVCASVNLELEVTSAMSVSMATMTFQMQAVGPAHAMRVDLYLTYATRRLECVPVYQMSEERTAILVQVATILLKKAVSTVNVMQMEQ